MDYFVYLSIFIFGSIVGSFLNVLILRYHTGRGVSGRSHCPACNKTLQWYELVPIASFLAQAGHCRKCESRISLQYPLVEGVTGLLFLLVFLTVSTLPLILAYWWVVVSILVFIAVYDLYHTIIPEEAVWLFVTLALFSPFGPGFLNRFLTGVIVAAIFAALWYFSHGRWLGLGDAKLVLGIGLALGFPVGLSATVLAFWIGAAFGLVLIVVTRIGSKLPAGARSYTMKSEVPFAPFLIFGFLAALLAGFNVLLF